MMSNDIVNKILLLAIPILILTVQPTQIKSYNLPESRHHTTTTTTATATATLSSHRRRILLLGTFPAAAITTISSLPTVCSAVGFFDQNKDRRQLELCLVNILRLQYWAQTIAYTMENPESTSDQRKSAYLEARLGGKAVVAEKQKVGGGGSLRVFTLKGLQIKDCLKDLKYYSTAMKKNNKQLGELNDNLLEALASLVEFDGLESTQDPSPRSSLTLGMYNADKEIYVRRMLSERIIGLISDIVDVFGPTTREQCEQYVAEYYPTELPPSMIMKRGEGPVAEATKETSLQ